MNSFAYASAPDDEYVIVTYAIKNVSGAQLTNLHAGLFADWDVHPNSGLVNPDAYYASNRTGFEPARNLAYAWYDTTEPTVHVGIVALDSAASYRGLLLATTPSFTRATKWDWLTGGVVPETARGDVHFVLSSGPYVIDNNLSVKVPSPWWPGAVSPTFRPAPTRPS